MSGWFRDGDGPRNHPAIEHLNLGPLGYPGRPSPLLTKTLLFLGEGLTNIDVDNDPRVPPGMPAEIVTNSGGNKFRAYDKATGETLWETELPAGTTGPPVSYTFGGQQYIVVAIGDNQHPAELVAFSLP